MRFCGFRHYATGKVDEVKIEPDLTAHLPEAKDWVEKPVRKVEILFAVLLELSGNLRAVSDVYSSALNVASIFRSGQPPSHTSGGSPRMRVAAPAKRRSFDFLHLTINEMT
jgi:hypothetical protein